MVFKASTNSQMLGLHIKNMVCKLQSSDLEPKFSNPFSKWNKQLCYTCVFMPSFPYLTWQGKDETINVKFLAFL